jgi:serine/threonine-protein kinase RsbW
MSQPSRVRLDSSLPQLDVLHEELRQFADLHHLSAEVSHAFKLSLEEIVTNIIVHGYRGQAGRPIVVQISQVGPEIVATVEDQAPPFTPLEQPAPDFTVPARDRPPGGLGIFLVRKMMDRVEFQRVNGHNQLTLRKRFGAT